MSLNARFQRNWMTESVLARHSKFGVSKIEYVYELPSCFCKLNKITCTKIQIKDSKLRNVICLLLNDTLNVA